MFKHPSLLLIFPLIAALGVIYLTIGDDSPYTETVNAVIGDESYVQIFGEKPGPDVTDRVRIQTHLEYVSDVLLNRPVEYLTEEQQKNRKKYLNLLNDYINTGEFPHNDGHPDERRPTFISEDGHICAVGYLVEQSTGREFAETISRGFKYAFIPEIDHPQFLIWAEQSGFSMEELAMIQPMYGTIVTEEKRVNENKPGAPFGIGSTLLGGVNALYFSNSSADPWMFNNPAHSHWFGLTTGSASIVLGALNLRNTRVYTTPQTMICMGICTVTEVTETNHARTWIAAANIGIGLVSVVRAGYHLIGGTGQDKLQPSGLGVRQIIAEPLHLAEPVPALSYTIRF
jgi:hypothetical protein